MGDYQARFREKGGVKLPSAYSTEFVQMDYVRRIMAEIDERSRIATAIKKGQDEGKAEVAKNLLEMGVPAETVAKATGLSAEEIAAL